LAIAVRAVFGCILASLTWSFVEQELFLGSRAWLYADAREQNEPHQANATSNRRTNQTMVMATATATVKRTHL
jgi:hypothetical protein